MMSIVTAGWAPTTYWPRTSVCRERKHGQAKVLGNSHLSRLRAGSQRTLAGAGSEDEGWEMGEAHRRGRAAGKCPLP